MRFLGYCHLKPEVVDWICKGYSFIPDNSMDALQVNCVLRVKYR